MYQAGGAAQGSILQEIAKLPQEQQKQIMAAFGKWAQSKGLNIQQLQGNEQALEQAMNQFLQEMQGAQKARLGAKLNYLRSIKGSCPEGQKLVYFREGGIVCKRCIEENTSSPKGMAAIKAFKDKCGSKMKKKSCKESGGEIQADKCGSKMKKSKKEFGGEIQFDKCGSKMKKKSCKEFGGNIESDKCGSKMKKKSCKELGGNIESDKCGSKMKAQNGIKTKSNNKTSNNVTWTQKDDKKLLKYRRMGTKTPAEKRDSLNIQRKWNNLPEKEKAKYEVQEQKCGGKAKKHLYGGSLNRIPFQQGGAPKEVSFKNAWDTARKNKVRYFNWNGRMYNSMDKGNDVAYQSFRDNMRELSAQLPTDRSPKHLGWEKNNPISNELRGNDRELQQHGTEAQLQNITIIGTRKYPTKKQATKKQSNFKVTYNIPMGAIEYTGRDGKQYWMRQNHSNGQYYYIDRSKPISYATTAVPEGYIIPGTNFKINKGVNIGKLALGLEKKWL